VKKGRYQQSKKGKRGGTGFEKGNRGEVERKAGIRVKEQTGDHHSMRGGKTGKYKEKRQQEKQGPRGG